MKMAKLFPFDILDQRMNKIAAGPDLHVALLAIANWGREHASPTDLRSPHQLLTNTQAALAKED